MKQEKEPYAISPEFGWLKRFPIPKTRLQILAVQLFLSRTADRQRSDERVRVIKTEIASKAAPGGTIPTLIYSDKKAGEEETLPCVLFLHGGAFLLPAFPYHFRLSRRIAEKVHCRVVLPLYHLAPEYVPPLQQEEAFEVYTTLLAQPDVYRIDTGRIAVIGDSAGGTLTAALTLMARERNVPQPRAQALFYPSLDDKLESASMKQYTDVPVINATAIREYYKLCRHDEYRGNRDYISPVDAASLEGLPEAYVETAEFDALHDDGIRYARRLKEAGVPVTLNETKGTVHAFDMAGRGQILSKTIARRIRFLQKVLQSD